MADKVLTVRTLMRQLTEMKKQGLADAEIALEVGSFADKAFTVKYAAWDASQKVVVIGDRRV